MPHRDKAKPVDESKEGIAPPAATTHYNFPRSPNTSHTQPHLIVDHSRVNQYITSTLSPNNATTSTQLSCASASTSESVSSALPLAMAPAASPGHPPIASVISGRYVSSVDTLSRCLLFANSDNPRLLVAHRLNKTHTDAYDDALMAALRSASATQQQLREEQQAEAEAAVPQDAKGKARAQLDAEPNPFEQDDVDAHTPRFHARDSSAAPQHFTSEYVKSSPSQHTRRTPSNKAADIDDVAVELATFHSSSPNASSLLRKPQSSSASHLDGLSPQSSPTTQSRALHVDPGASPRVKGAAAVNSGKSAAGGAAKAGKSHDAVIEPSAAPLKHRPGGGDEWTEAEQVTLAEQILLMYVEVYWQNQKAFAPFYRRPVRSWRDKATLVYEHLMQSRRKESKLNQWRRRWHTRHIKRAMVAFFERELQRLDEASANATHAHHHLNQRVAQARQRRDAALAAARTLPSHTLRRQATARSTKATKPADATQGGEPRLSLRRQLTQAELSVPLDVKDATTIPPPSDEYFSRLNEACGALHARYVEVSEAVGDEIVRRLLTPALPEAIVDAAALNREVIGVMHSRALLPSLLSYHPEYQNAVLGFPGLVLMSRTLRRQLENPSHEFEQLQMTDLIVAVNELTEILRTAFHKLVAVRPQLLETLVRQHRFGVLRTVLDAEEAELQRERERGREPYPGSFSFWLYDSQLYPRRFNNESLLVLRHVNKRDARIFCLVAAHRFDQAARRLRQLGDDSKARWLELLIQRRKQESRNSMVGLPGSMSDATSTTSMLRQLRVMDSLNSPAAAGGGAGKAAAAALEARSPATNPLASPHDALLSPSSGGEEMEAAAQDGRSELLSDEYEDITTGRPEYYGAKMYGISSHTTYGHIHKWVDISAQYVVGLGRNEDSGELEPWAVYDKTFNEPLFDDLWTTLQVGFMTRENIHSHQLALKRMKKAESVQQFLANVLFSSAATTSQSINVQAAFFDDPLLIWKEGRRPADIAHPTRPIAFDDFDWLQMFISHPELQPLITCVADLNDLVNPRSNKRWPLHHCYFQRQEDGSYRLPLNRSKTIQPVKVVDIKFPQASFQPAITRAIFTNLIKGGLSGIPFYGPTQLMSALLERVFDFTDILYLQRHAQAAQLVAEAIDGSDTSPFSHPVFTRAMLDSATFYLLRTNIMLSAVIINTVSANETLASSYIAKIDAKRQQAVELLQARGFTVVPFPNAYYALTYMRDAASGRLTKLKIHSLGFRKIARSKKPHAAVDLFRPHRERRKRLVLQYLLTMSNFFYVPIPGVGGVGKMIYKEVFVREIHKRQMWESGLLAHMHHNPGQLSALLQAELRMEPRFAAHVEAQCLLILEERRLSPFDMNAEEMETHRAIVETWIRQHDPEYEALSSPLGQAKTEIKTHDVRPPDRTPAAEQPPEPKAAKRQFSRSALME